MNPVMVTVSMAAAINVTTAMSERGERLPKPHTP